MSLRNSAKLTVKEVFDNFEPGENGTGCDLVSFGPDAFFLVIQGDQANLLTGLMMEFLNQLQAQSDDISD